MYEVIQGSVSKVQVFYRKDKLEMASLIGQILHLIQKDHEVQSAQLEFLMFYMFEIVHSSIYILFLNNFDASFVFNRDQWKIKSFGPKRSAPENDTTKFWVELSTLPRTENRSSRKARRRSPWIPSLLFDSIFFNICFSYFAFWSILYNHNFRNKYSFSISTGTFQSFCCG